jgi:bifunctional non-homologous end joining protein LigD
MATVDGARPRARFSTRRLLRRRELYDAGKVGTGFGSREGSELIARLREHERKQSPFREVPRADAREARWAEPVTVAEVEFTDWTRDRRVRHPSLKGIREDKEAREVRRETRKDRQEGET